MSREIGNSATREVIVLDAKALDEALEAFSRIAGYQETSYWSGAIEEAILAYLSALTPATAANPFNSHPVGASVAANAGKEGDR